VRNEKTSQRITFSVPLYWGNALRCQRLISNIPPARKVPVLERIGKVRDALDQRVRLQAILGGNLPGLVDDPLVEDVVIKMPPAPPLAGVVARQMPGIRDPLTCGTRLRRRIEAALALHLSRQSGLGGRFPDVDICHVSRCAGEGPIEVRCQSPAGLLDLPARLGA
jgi:hypothetical protein